MPLATELNITLRDALNTHLFFAAMLHLFKNSHSIGEPKARQILAAIAHAAPTPAKTIPRPRDIASYRPSDPRLYINDLLRQSLIALSEDYYEPRKLGPALVNIKVVAKPRFKSLEISINQCRLRLRLDNSLHLWLHREIGNSLHYKTLAVLTAIRQFANSNSKPAQFASLNPDLVELARQCSANKYVSLMAEEG